MYARLARWCFRHSWYVIGGWVAILAITAGTISQVGPSYDGTFTVPESESLTGSELLTEYFGGFGGGQAGAIVFRADEGVTNPQVEETMTDLFTEMQAEMVPDGALEGLTLQSPYMPGAEQLIAPGGQIAQARINVPNSIDQNAAAAMGEYINELVDEKGLNDTSGLQVEVGGAVLGAFEPPESEVLGIAFAVFVLIVAMGSVVAMGTTIAVALTGVGIGAISIGLLSNVISIPDTAVTIGLMIGIGVGIDYALFIVTRYREALSDGFDPEGATAVALDTAGRSVIFAGFTVVVSLMGLLIIGVPFIAGLGLGAAMTVAVVMASSITLLPAALGLVQRKVNTTKWRGMVASVFIAMALLVVGLSLPIALAGISVGLAVISLIIGYLPIATPLKKSLAPRRESPLRDTVWYRWSHQIQARPWFYVILSSLILLGLAVPLLWLNLGFSDEGNFSEETTTRRAYDLISEGFGAGANGPFILITELNSPADLQTLGELSATLNGTDGVAFASPPIPNDPNNPAAAIIQLQPTTSPQASETEDLVATLRENVVPTALSGTGLEPKLAGATAASIDFTSYLAGRIILFFAVVLTLSFLLLMAVFRSLLVPLKAVIMNMLSIGAAYGVVVAVFQFGLFGIEGAPIEPFIPMLMFAIVFGLSMDYEVFILSRMKEEFERTGDATNSVADGLAATARVITAAAAIMVVVFGSFMFEDSRIIKLFGLGLASAVLIDATIVRMLLVPATMQLLGARNWWLPAWLDRILPNLNVEGEHHEPPVSGSEEVDPEREPVLA